MTRCPHCGVDAERVAVLLEQAAAELRGEIAPGPTLPNGLANRIAMLADRARDLRIAVPPEGLSEKCAADVADVHLSTLRRWRKEGRGTDWKQHRAPYRWTLEILARAQSGAHF